MNKINTFHGGSRGLDNFNSVNEEENSDLTDKFLKTIVRGTSSRNLAGAKRTFKEIVSETPKKPRIADLLLCLDDWCQKSIDQLQSLQNRVDNLSKWDAIRENLKDLLESLEPQIIKHEQTIMDLISRPPSFPNKMREESMNQLCNLKYQVGRLYNSLDVFSDKCVKQRRPAPRVVIDRLTDLKYWIGNIKRLARLHPQLVIDRLRNRLASDKES